MAIGKDSVIIIAEAGVNHNGDIALAKQLIDVAAEAGVDYVKFQTFKSENLVSPEASKADYQKLNEGESGSQLDMLKRLELSYADFEILKDYCAEKGVQFLSTGFDLESLDFLNNLGIPFFKVPSGEITHWQYLKKIAGYHLPIVLSTGMCEMDEIHEAIQLFENEGVPKSEITLLHCNTEYPTPFEDVNLLAMPAIGEAFGVEFGYSDHTPGISVSVAAVALGARVIEKHFTLDRNMPGPDHFASLEPTELKEMVKAIREVEKSLGQAEKKPSPSELKNRIPARKSLYAAQEILAGERIEEISLMAMRPGDGISAMKTPEVIGKIANRKISVGEKLRPDMFD